MESDDLISRSIADLDPDHAKPDPEAFGSREEFLAAVLVRSPQAPRDILHEEPCQTCAAFEREMARVEAHNRLLRGALVFAGAVVTAAVITFACALINR